jgi:hypothetical protein
MFISQTINLKPRRLNLKLDQIIISQLQKLPETIVVIIALHSQFAQNGLKVLTSISRMNVGQRISKSSFQFLIWRLIILGLYSIHGHNQAHRHSGVPPKSMGQSEVDARPDRMLSGDYHRIVRKDSGAFGGFRTHTLIPWSRNDSGDGIPSFTRYLRC